MKTIILSIGLFCYIHVAAQTEKLTLAENRLRGNVKSVSSTANWLKQQFGEWETAHFFWSENASFSKKGFLVNSSRQEDIDYGQVYVFKYDRNDHLVEKQNTYGKKKNKQERIFTSLYDAEGHEIQLDLASRKGQLYWRQKMTYRDDGKISELVTYDGQGDFISREHYEYDEKGNCVEIRDVNKKGQIIKRTASGYDAAGKKVKEVIETRVINPAIIRYSWEYRNGLMTLERKVIEITKKKDQVTVKEFDQWGNATRVTQPSGTIYTTEYVFDSNNNWTSALCTFKDTDGLNGYRIDREIKYY